MADTRTRILLFAATLLSGVLAGAAIDRVIVGGPAWHELGAEAWVQYSRHADLGTGLVAYPIEGIGSTLLTIAAVVSSYLDGNRRMRAALPLYCAVAFSVAGLILTTKAAPIMLDLSKAQPPAAVQTAFEEFFFWGLYLRGSLDTLAFADLVWALTDAYRIEQIAVPPRSPHKPNS